LPLYEYKCEDCGKVTAEIQKLSDPPLTNCPECNGKLTKLVSQSSFRLKGEGWTGKIGKRK
jgi:putative FmdB family regulatory protein